MTEQERKEFEAWCVTTGREHSGRAWRKSCALEAYLAARRTQSEQVRELVESLQGQVELRNGDLDKALTTIATLTAERDRLSRICDELLAHCDKEGGECSRCGEIVCDLNEPLHFHHDGCPACSMDEPSQLKEQDDD